MKLCDLHRLRRGIPFSVCCTDCTCKHNYLQHSICPCIHNAFLQPNSYCYLMAYFLYSIATSNFTLKIMNCKKCKSLIVIIINEIFFGLYKVSSNAELDGCKTKIYTSQPLYTQLSYLYVISTGAFPEHSKYIITLKRILIRNLHCMSGLWSYKQKNPNRFL